MRDHSYINSGQIIMMIPSYIVLVSDALRIGGGAQRRIEPVLSGHKLLGTARRLMQDIVCDIVHMCQSAHQKT